MIALLIVLGLVITVLLVLRRRRSARGLGPLVEPAVRYRLGSIRREVL